MDVTTFIVQLTDYCNLECGYCFARPTFSNTKMSESTLERIITQIDSLGQKSVHFLWHGGEPLLLGLDGFKFGVEVQKNLNTRFYNSVQTNGTLIDDSFADFFKENEFSIGISIDGYEQVQNLNRPMRNGFPSFQKVIEGVERLRKRNIDFSCISVISTETNPSKYLNFVYDLGVRSFALKPSISDWKYSLSLSEYTGFYQKVVQDWLDLDDPSIVCRNFMGYAQNMISGSNLKTLCSESGLCGYFAFVKTSGEVYPCDELTDQMYCWGNITENTLANILSSSERKLFLEKVNHHLDDCKEKCEIYNVCNGGCTFCHKFYGSHDYCDHLRKIISIVEKLVLTGVSELEDEAAIRYLDPNLLHKVKRDFP